MNNLDRQYQGLLKDILDNGYQKGDRTGTGSVAVFGRMIVHDMSEGFPLLTSKKMAFKQIITELLWFLRGETNIRSLVLDGNNIWVGDAYKRYVNEFAKATNGDSPDLSRAEFIEKIKEDEDFADKWGELGPVYGKQWRAWDCYPKGNGVKSQIDQIATALWKLENKPDDRRIMVNAWNVDQIEDAVLPPCHYGFQLDTRELTDDERYDICSSRKNKMSAITEEDYVKYNIPKRAISLKWEQRSVDTPLGLPFNIASYGALLMIFAKFTNMVPEYLIGSLGNTHIYNDQIEPAKVQITRNSHPLPTLEIDVKDYGDPDQLSYEDFTLKDYKYEDKLKYALSN